MMSPWWFSFLAGTVGAIVKSSGTAVLGDLVGLLKRPLDGAARPTDLVIGVIGVAVAAGLGHGVVRCAGLGAVHIMAHITLWVMLPGRS